jgi:hypothetical protein
MSMPNFIQIHPFILELNHANRQTDMTSVICVNFVCIMQRTHNNSGRLDQVSSEYKSKLSSLKSILVVCDNVSNEL